MILSTSEQLGRARDYLAGIPGAAEAATARALNQAAEAGRQRAVEAIVERYAANATDVRARITLTTARPDALGVAVVARSPSLALGYFPHSPTLPGTGGTDKPALRAEVLRGGVKDVGGAFIATINGKPRIMIRTGKITDSGKAAIRSVYTVPIAEMLGASSVRGEVEDRALEVLDQHLTREIDRALQGAA